MFSVSFEVLWALGASGVSPWLYLPRSGSSMGVMAPVAPG